MVKAQWGTKRVCPHCGTRYYDMKKNPPVCPKCATVLDLESVSKTRKHRAAPEDKSRKAAPAPEEMDDLPPVGDDDNDVLIEDVDELGEDEVEEVYDVDGDRDE